MSKRKSKKELNDGKLPKLWEYLVYLHKEHPDAFEHGADYLRTLVARNKWHALQDPTKCPNCGESMQEYIYKLDFLNALLVKQMGDIVKQRLKDGMEFQEANAIHVVSEETMSDAVRHRTSQCRILGLVAKVKNEEGKHDRDKGWLITRRGFEALRGVAVPAEVIAFRNEIRERPETKTTLDEVFNNYSGEKKDLVGNRSALDWVHFSKYYEGIL